MSLEDFITKAKGLIGESGYHQDFKEEMLRETLVFGLNSDKVRKEAIAPENKLTFQQRLTKAKTEESTTAKMKAITQGSSQIKIKKRTLCVAARGIQVDFQDHRAPQNALGTPKIPKSSKIDTTKIQFLIQ